MGLLCLAASLVVVTLLMTVVKADDEVDEEFDVNKFYCRTRYGLLIPQESARRTSCQKGYDEKKCEGTAGDDKDGTAMACEEGMRAFHDLNPEPKEDAEKMTATMAQIPAQRATAQSGTNSCGDVDTAFLSCRVPAALGIQGTGLGALLNIIINIMAIGAGIVAVGALVFAGITYASSSDNDAQVKKAKDIIKNTIIGLVMFAFMYLIIQFIIPGGLF